jgi:O-acetylhomoserine (thiol)-lyase
MDDWGFETTAIHAGELPEKHGGATRTPIFETTSFAYGTAGELEEAFAGRKFGHIYSRISNPTVTSFEQKMSRLEGGVGALAAASGMAAISTVLFTLTRGQDEVVFGRSLFGGTFHLLDQVLGRYGVKARYVDPVNLKAIEGAVTERTKLLFVEAIGNPRLDVPDIRGISEIAKNRGIPLVVDGTLTTPYLFQAKEHGANIVVHSTTKYITGNGSTIGGVVVDLGNFDWASFPDEQIKETAGRIGAPFAFLAAARRNIQQNTGGCLSPFSAYLHNLGVETLALRMDRHCSNAQALAEFLSRHPDTTEVVYPGLKDNRFFEIARRQFGDRFGGMLTVSLESKEMCFKVIDNLKLVKNLANLGDAKTLVIHPASTIYQDCSAEENEAFGVTNGMIRVSVGIERIDDIVRDFESALREANK